MSFRYFSHQSVAIVLWATPELADVEALIVYIRAERERRGVPVLYVSIVPHGAPPPATDVMKEMIRRFPDLNEHCEAIVQVFEGEGFASGFKRSVLTGMILAVNQCVPVERRLQVRSESTLAGVITKVPVARRSEWLGALAAYRATSPVVEVDEDYDDDAALAAERRARRAPTGPPGRFRDSG
jgi:hypothetical protein